MFRESGSNEPLETSEEIHIRMIREIFALEAKRKKIDREIFRQSTEDRIKNPKSKEHDIIWTQILEQQRQWKIFFPNEPFPVNNKEV